MNITDMSKTSNPRGEEDLKEQDVTRGRLSMSGPDMSC